MVGVFRIFDTVYNSSIYIAIENQKTKHNTTVGSVNVKSQSGKLAGRSICDQILNLSNIIKF